MKTDTAVLLAEDHLFAALSAGDGEALGRVVADDCTLIDVLTGSEVPRAEFVDLVGSHRLVFGSIERIGARVRLYGDTAVVTGQTRMIGHFGSQPFQVHSRYTHVYARQRDGLRLINAQGTPIAPAGPVA
jgi:ketosteroid isomerase-like protein